MLRPVRRRALSDEVFEQLREQIVSGALAAGDPLPAERVLCEAFAVNRGSVREALRRLQQARLVSVRHGGTSLVLDFRSSAGLDLLPDLLTGARGEPDLDALRSVLEMRSALGPDVARLAAERASAAERRALGDVVARMRAAGGDLARLQDLSAELWTHLVEASRNIAYRLAYNSLRAPYDLSRTVFTQVLAAEIADVDSHAALAAAVAGGDAAGAEHAARALLRRGESAVKEALGRISRGAPGPRAQPARADTPRTTRPRRRIR
jgi:DNA-binding FadR family transcriptional regulator